MADIQVLRSQEYSTNLELLSQQMMPKLAPYCTVQQATGSKAFRMLSQIDQTEAVNRTTSAKPAINVDVTHDGRWVYPSKHDWGKVVDDIDLMQTNIQPQGAYVRSAIAAMNRKSDDQFLTAFFGTAQTGETGATSTSFLSANQVLTTVGATTGLNVDKLRAAKKILLENEVDTDMETIYAAISPEQHDNLLALTQVVSTDFNTRPVLVDGMVQEFMGIRFVISNRLPTDGDGYRRIPVWVPSGMGCGMWQEISGTIRNRPDLQGNPDYVEATMMKGFTRLEEAKCVEIKCAEA